MFTMSLGLSMGCGMLPQATLEKGKSGSRRAGSVTVLLLSPAEVLPVLS